MTFKFEFEKTLNENSHDILTPEGKAFFDSYKAEGKIVSNQTIHTMNEEGNIVASGFIEFIDEATKDEYLNDISGLHN